METQLKEVYARLYVRFGAQSWWPGDGAFEVIVGAILTQNTSWTNVEKAMTNLKRAKRLTPTRLHHLPIPRLAQLIRPSGYFNLKAKKLRAFTRYLFAAHHGSLAHLFRLDTATLRAELLTIYGIGPETADSIILYAARQPIFVVDAYTRRIMARLGLAHPDSSYDELQHLFMEYLPVEERLFNEYHALIVVLGKDTCKKSKPRCGECPLLDLCPTGRERALDEAM